MMPSPKESFERSAPETVDLKPDLATLNLQIEASLSTEPEEYSLQKVKEEAVTPQKSLERNRNPNELSTPKPEIGDNMTNSSNLVGTTSPPIFSMDVITDVLGEIECQESPVAGFSGHLGGQLSPTSTNFLRDISAIEKQADSAATAFLNASKSARPKPVHQKDSAGAVGNASGGFLHMEHPLFDMMSPDVASNCSSPWYLRVYESLGQGGGDEDSTSSKNDSDASDSEFELDGESSSPSEDSSDSDFNMDSDSDYGGRRRKVAKKPGKRITGKISIPGIRRSGHLQHRRPFHHQKTAKSKKQIALMMGGGQSASKPINAQQLEAIAASMGSSPVTVNWLWENYETSEGNSLPRALMYGHYLRHCAELRLDPVNAASFGKLIRSVFVGLTTRRLGTRGNSKYHYCGIRIKDTSTLLLEDPDLSKKTRTNGKRSKKTQILAMQGGICGLGGSKGLHLEIGVGGQIDYSSVKKYLGTRCATFPDIAISEFYLPEGVSYEDMLCFAEIYKKHCLGILEATELFKLNTDLEKIWLQFWQREDCYGVQGFFCNNGITFITRDALMALTQVPEIRYAIETQDAYMYDQILRILMPNVIAQLPFQLLEEYHKLARTTEKWLTSALMNYDEEFKCQKLALVRSFNHELQAWVSLNLSAQAARDSLQCPNSIAKLLSDLNRINFRSVLMDVKEYVSVHEMDINVHESLKRILSGPDSIEPWSVWLVGLVDQRLAGCGARAAQDAATTVNAVIKECQDLNLRWLKYMSQLRLELLLRSSGSLETFLSLELLFSNFLLHLIKVYKSRALQVPLVMYSILRSKKEAESIAEKKRAAAARLSENNGESNLQPCKNESSAA